MKSFGSQWLNDWEDAHEPEEPYTPPPPDPRALIIGELAPILSESLARKVADGIMTKLKNYLRP